MDTTDTGDAGLDDIGGGLDSGESTAPTETAPVQTQTSTADPTTDRQPANRQERRDMYKEKRAAEADARASREENRRLREAVEKLTGNIEKVAPKQPGPRDHARDRWLSAARKLDPNDQTSMNEFLEATRGYSTEGIQDELVQKVMEKVQGQLPAQRPPVVQRLLTEFDWAQDDQELQEEIALETRRAARRRNVSLDGLDPQTMYRFMREGAIAVAKANNLPIPGANGRDGTARDRFAGTSGRSGFGGGSGAATPVSSEDRARIIEATSNMGGEYKGKSADERVAMFTKKHLRA